MNPAKRKKLYRAVLAEEKKQVEVPAAKQMPVVEEKKVEAIKPSEPVLELPKLALQELPKEETIVAQPVTEPSTVVTKKKKV